jgi:hypothetical protein
MPALSHGLLPRGVRAFLLRRQVMNEIRELTEVEVEAVSGGSSFSSLLPSITVNAPVDVQIGTQVIAATQTAVSAFGNAGNQINGGLTNLDLQSVVH